MNSNAHNRYGRTTASLSILIALLVFSGGFALQAEAQDCDGDHDGHDHSSHKAATPHADHDGHDDHGHRAHSEEDGLKLTPEQRKRFGITIRKAGAGKLDNVVSLPGEIVFNEDRVVHMVPRVSGIARKVTKSIGDRVGKGEVLAVIDSRELADAKAEYLAASARQALAEKTYLREKKLHDKDVSSEQDFLVAEQSFAEAKISLRSTEQKLHALGLSEKDIAALNEDHSEAITRYEIRSPIDGVVTEKHISLGESLGADDHILTIVDTSSVWANMIVYSKNLEAVSKGKDVVLTVEHSGAQARGKIAMVTPFMEETTRSATARVVLDNSDNRLVPGSFVTGLIRVSEDNVRVVVPKGAVQSIEGRSVVFIEHEGAFEMMPVTTGRSDRNNIEVLSGLKAGTHYAAEGAFELKATVITSSLDSHAGHGH